MKATVIRNGQHSGGNLFVEVQEGPSSPPYAVPVSAELPIGTEVEITVKVVEVPKEPSASLDGTDVSVTSAPPLVVPTSPIVEGANPGARIDTAPSGSAQFTDGEMVAKNAQVANEAKGAPKGPVSHERNEGRDATAKGPGSLGRGDSLKKGGR